MYSIPSLRSVKADCTTVQGISLCLRSVEEEKADAEPVGSFDVGQTSFHTLQPNSSDQPGIYRIERLLGETLLSYDNNFLVK